MGSDRTFGQLVADYLVSAIEADGTVVAKRMGTSPRRTAGGVQSAVPVPAALCGVDCGGEQDHAVFMERRVRLTPTKVQSLLKELRASLEDLYGDNLVGIRLFGSYARRQATPDSDVDVLLVLREIGDYGTEVRRVSDLLSRVSLECGKTIVPVFVDAKRLAAASDPFMANVAREAVPA